MGDTRDDDGVQRVVRGEGEEPEEWTGSGAPDQDETTRGHDLSRWSEGDEELQSEGDEELELPEPFSSPL
ncbi:hypothetical protein GCM10010266_58440 [Streptomyces griseomycini]|uniref:Uncharacterized protein n=1 Tax=Streptomyces griseomycini TaxID=66895 RepID=A0A7W7VA01_9ACTN|nr:hypothetical protein [Streptomyces griseomycini]GGQ27428.1 hypothetical protein GCM10010266_58440 [Streptomyces griseomycini]GGR46543.1 hypothetical protein GCM10015536_60450 [Streptomyces griseomycini]